MTDLTLWENSSSLTSHEKKELQKQIKLMDDVVEIIKVALDEESQTAQYANEKVSDTLIEAEARKNESGHLSDSAKTNFQYVTQDYLDTVIKSLVSNDTKLLQEIERAAGGKINLNLLESHNFSLLEN